MPASSGGRRSGAVFKPKRPGMDARRELRTRVRARLQRARLDRLLVAGEAPWASRDLSWRAAELTAPDERHAIADQIDRLVYEAMGPPRPRGAAVPLDRDGLRSCRHLLLELTHDLRRAELVRPQGVALLRRLLRDGGSPLYAPGETHPLQIALIRARAALLRD